MIAHLASIVVAFAFQQPPAEARDLVWIEGEKPTAIDVKPNIAGWGNKTFLSDEKWLHVNVEPADFKTLPAAGATIRYDFQTTVAGRREVWNRVGFEFVRSPFSWRIDGGNWTVATPDTLTIDLMEIAFFCEVAWLKLGDVDLEAGPHSLEIRLTPGKDAKGQPERILYASDLICLSLGAFHPDGPHRPGVDARTDADRKAAATSFTLPSRPGGGRRAVVELAGTWEIARDDEQLPGPVAQPIAALPAHPNWRAIAVPGDKNTLRPDLVFAHRVWYRTTVEVPREELPQSYVLVFPQNNLNTTVFINGKFCGFDKNPLVRVEIDVTKAVVPGRNEICVGIRDAWYARSRGVDDPLKLRKTFNLPIKFFSDGFQDLAYPVWNHAESGILATPLLVSTGASRVTDVFVKPSVARKELAVDVTIAGGGARTREVLIEVVDAEGRVVKKFAPRPIAGALTVVEPWPDAKTWWPDEPWMYRLRTTVRVAGELVDVVETPFGFREWTTRGKDFLLNGVPWRGYADTHSQPTPSEWLAFHKSTNQGFMRFWGTSWMGMTPAAALDYFDARGVVVRRSGILDGEAIGYMAVETDPALRKKYGSEIKMELMENWRDQMLAQVREERNHPSVMIWSIENEWLYINCINLYGGLMDAFEAETARTSDLVRALDPTRPTMTDGGGAGKANRMPVHGDHYTAGAFPLYPSLAYEPNVKGGGRGRWEWDQKRPRFIGEELFAQGHNPAYSYFGGEEVFSGRAGTLKAVGILVRMMTEGARWTGVAAIHFWQTQDAAVGQYAANAPRAAFVRQWDWTFGSGTKVKRTYGLFNDTRHDDTLSFVRTLVVDGRELGRATTHRVEPGGKRVLEETLDIPKVDRRVEGQLVLTLSKGDVELFRDVKAVSILPPPRLTAVFAAADLAVYDPSGETLAWLKARGIPHTPIKDLDRLPASRIVLIGKDALTERESGSTRLAALAMAGRRVVVLEQKHPLKYQGVQPAEIEAETNEGRIAFVEDASHPALRGLASKDFFTWTPAEVVYRDAYAKPTRGARSLVQCHELLKNSALVEIPVGDGLLVLSQLMVASTLDANPVADQLLVNLIDHAAVYKREFRPVVAVVAGSPRLAASLDALGLRYETSNDPLAAIDRLGAIAVVAATPENLGRIATSPAKLKRFQASGGYLVLNGLTPDGLASFNRIVGVDHMIRPFRRERVTFPAVKDPLAAGLSLGDVALYSSERIFPWQEGNFVASDVFAHVVDYDEVAPFAKFDNEFLANMVNGFVSADAWKYIVNVPAPPRPPLDFHLQLPRAQEIVEVEWIGNTFYYPVTKFSIVFDGSQTATFAVQPNNEPQTFTLNPSRTGRDLTLRLADWTVVPGKGAVTGLDNIRLKAKRTPEFYARVKPMLNVGGLVHYPKGPGGVVLANFAWPDNEQGPGNLEKKRAALAVILRNLRAPFAGSRTIIAGAALTYTPVDISKRANQFRTERGWFGDAATTFKDLPAGRNTFAGVPFEVFDFKTSPVPTVVMLGGPGVPNSLPDAVRDIAINRKVDALFFLQAARIDRGPDAREIKEKTPVEVARYVVHYADGQSLDVPILAGLDAADYRQRTPAALPRAQVGWTRPYPGRDDSAVAYVKQWTNPRPEVVVRSIDLVSGKDRRGVPALIAITAASARP